MSPAFLSHLEMVPSKIDSPICGITTSVPPITGPAAETCGATASPISLTTATTVLISTVAPSATLISLSTPATGEGISASTLSVEISNSGSSFSTGSPAFLSHLVMVPSKIDSPIWGMITSVGMDPLFATRGIGARPVPAGL